MNESTSPRRVIHDSEIDNLIDGETKTFDGWLERLTKNGPGDQTAAAEVAASTARYNHLVSIKRGYLS
jgi:hypothetical protein